MAKAVICYKCENPTKQYSVFTLSDPIRFVHVCDNCGGDPVFVLLKAVKVLEQYATKNKHFKPRWISIGWSFCGIFTSIESAMEAQMKYLMSLPPGQQENPPEFKIKEVPIGVCISL